MKNGMIDMADKPGTMMLGNVRDRRNGAGRWEGAIECSPPTPPFSFTLLNRREIREKITGNVDTMCVQTCAKLPPRKMIVIITRPDLNLDMLA
jgi:hypothetical protein